MNEEILKLKNQLCFPLYAASKGIVSRYSPFLEKIDLTYTQYITMLVLWEFKCVSVKELGEHLYLDSGTLTPLLKRLEAKDLIRRERDSADERAVNISITAKGENLKVKAAEIPVQMAKCLPLSIEETAVLYNLLYKVLNNTKND